MGPCFANYQEVLKALKVFRVKQVFIAGLFIATRMVSGFISKS